SAASVLIGPSQSSKDAVSRQGVGAALHASAAGSKHTPLPHVPTRLFQAPSAAATPHSPTSTQRAPSPSAGHEPAAGRHAPALQAPASGSALPSRSTARESSNNVHIVLSATPAHPTLTAGAAQELAPHVPMNSVPSTLTETMSFASSAAQLDPSSAAV